MTIPPLSPAAQAVLNAAGAVPVPDDAAFGLLRLEIAAALRAAADQVVPAPSAYASQDAGLIRDEILFIAEELDPQP